METVKLTDEQKDLLNFFGTAVTVGLNTYKYLPYWYKFEDGSQMQEQHSLDELPKDLTDYIHGIRGTKPEPKRFKAGQEVWLISNGLVCSSIAQEVVYKSFYEKHHTLKEILRESQRTTPPIVFETCTISIEEYQEPFNSDELFHTKAELIKHITDQG